MMQGSVSELVQHVSMFCCDSAVGTMLLSWNVTWCKAPGCKERGVRKFGVVHARGQTAAWRSFRRLAGLCVGLMVDAFSGPLCWVDD